MLRPATIAASGVAQQQLCVAPHGRPVDFASDCGTSVTVAPAPVERRVVWLTQDALVVGRLAAGDAQNILMNAGSPAPVRLELTRGENSAVLTFAAAR